MGLGGWNVEIVVKRDLTVIPHRAGDSSMIRLLGFDCP
jgi:hypothetical protein